MLWQVTFYQFHHLRTLENHMPRVLDRYCQERHGLHCPSKCTQMFHLAFGVLPIVSLRILEETIECDRFRCTMLWSRGFQSLEETPSILFRDSNQRQRMSIFYHFQPTCVHHRLHIARFCLHLPLDETSSKTCMRGMPCQ